MLFSCQIKFIYLRFYANRSSLLAFTILFFALPEFNKVEGSITANSSADYAVKIISLEDVVQEDCNLNQQVNEILNPDQAGEYTVCQGTTLVFEIDAQLTTGSSDQSLLVSYWSTLDGSIGWWWWSGEGRSSGAPPQAPEQPNTPSAAGNTQKAGLFAFEYNFDKVTEEGIPITIEATLSSEPVSNPNSSEESDSVDNFFFINVVGPADVTPPVLTAVPGGNESPAAMTVGIADRVAFALNANDLEGNLEGFEWYVAGFGAPLRVSGVSILAAFFGLPNVDGSFDDSFKYRFLEPGTFRVSAVAYDTPPDNLPSIFYWDVTVAEPLLTRALPHAAVISVKPEDTKTFKVLANTDGLPIDGVCWQNAEELPFYMPIADATPSGDFLAFTRDASFDFEVITGFSDATEVTATAYTENTLGEKILTENTVTWVVRAEKNVDNSRLVNFSGLEWKVKESNPLTQAIGPGNNYFSGSQENVLVDSAGLHLKLTYDEVSDRWLSAEVFTAHSMPRGIYRFYLEGGSGTQLDQLDPRVIFSPFFYADDTREIDIEFSNWLPSDPNGEGRFQYIVQPVSIDSIERYDLTLDDSAANAGKITCQIDWQDDRVIFTSWLGHSATPPAQETLLLETWTYSDSNDLGNEESIDVSKGSFLPESGDELRLHLNLYLKNNFVSGLNNSPGNDLPVHVIIKAIDHPASWKGWSVENFGERHTLSSSTIGGAQHDPDFDGYTNLLEYALGNDPWKADPDRQPQFEISPANYPNYIFTRRQAMLHPLSESLGGIYHTPFLDYYIKSKADLGDTINDWMDEPVDLIGDPTDLLDGTETVTYRTENTLEGVPQKFFQLQVEARDE